MTARLYTTVYDADDLPTEAVHVASKSLGTVNEWTELEYTHLLHGTPAFGGRISRHHPQAALLQQNRYLIFHSDAGPVGGAFLEEGKIDLSSKDGKGDEYMVWTGRGAMAILERGRLLEDWYSTEAAASPSRGQFTTDGIWEWGGPNSVDTIFFGGVLSRAVEEGQDEPGNPLAPVTMWGTDGYNRRLEDASGAAWTGLVEHFMTDIGTDVLSLVSRFDPFGVTSQMSYLFKLDAYNEGNLGTDRSGAFGPSTVRLERAIDIAAAIDRKVRGAVRRTHLLVGGAEYQYVTVTDPSYVSGDPAHWGFLAVPDSADPSDLEAIGLAHLAARERQTDALVFPLHDHGDSPSDGIYEPAPDIADGHFWVGDLVSYHTGSGEYDANEEAAPVAAITWQLKTGDEANGDYWIIVEIGSTFHWEEGDAFRGGTPGSQQRLLLCQPGTEGTSSTTRLYPSGNNSSILPATSALWDQDPNGSWGDNRMYETAQAVTDSSSSASHAASPGEDIRLAQFIFGPLTAEQAAVLAAGGATLRGQFRCRSRFGTGISEANQDNISQITARVTTGATTTIRGTAYAGHSLASSAGCVKWRAASTARNSLFPPAAASNVLSAVSGAAAGDYLAVEVGYRTFTITTTGGTLFVNDAASSDLPEDETTTSNLRSWIEFSTTGVGATTGDLPLDTVRQDEEQIGTSVRASRCDHQHAHGLLSTDGTNYHGVSQLANYIFDGDAAPGVNDDEGDGYVVGSHWIDSTTGFVYILTDATAGAAVWEQLSGEGSGTSDHGTLTGLADDDHPQYARVTDGEKHTVNVVSAAGSTETLDLGDGNYHDVTLTADCTLTLAGATNGVECQMRVLLRQGTGAPWAVTWPGSVEWVGGSAPTLQTAEDAWDRVNLETTDGGTTWLAQHASTSAPASGSTSGEILISDSPSTPLVFADLLQNDAQNDLLYAD